MRFPNLRESFCDFDSIRIEWACRIGFIACLGANRFKVRWATQFVIR